MTETTETAAAAATGSAPLPSPLQYLDRAIGRLRELGLVPEMRSEEAPVVALLDRIQLLAPEQVAVIARTLSQQSLFNEVVREQVRQMEVAQRYETITNAFNSIRDDSKMLVDQMEDGRISIGERFANMMMKMTRGDIAQRFGEIRETYLDVARDTKANIDREHVILEAYQDFRGALKQAEIAALEVLRVADGKLEVAKGALKQASDAVAAFAGSDPAERARLELARDEKMRALRAEEGRFQIAKDLSDNLTIGYNTSEVVMARLMQTTSAKERVYQQAISFFSTNESVFTALSASLTGIFGLHESTKTLDAMKEGAAQSLEVLAEIGGKVQEEALKAGYGPTIRADAVKALVDSVINFQTRSFEIIEEMRVSATKNSEEIREAVEDGKRRMARLAEEGKGLDLPA
ncbi:cell surface protein [Salinarimonas chemoclinalis]|uniref:cell surface protein n=1 Tax=Salinarimonas chemoclinalis TaxID=3241599 RepID=UPI003555FBAA